MTSEPTRLFEGRRVWQVTTPAFNAAIRLIADAERAHGPDLVVGIRRGGAPPATALASALGVRCAFVSARHNADDRIGLPATGRVGVETGDLGRAARRVLLVDDICGSGATLRAVRAALARTLPGLESVRAAALCRNLGAGADLDVWIWDVADWTVFPWEARPARPVESLPLPSGVRRP
ncbi:phosphoribosyltransferase [Actinomadura atramentaria]|uniref:phosphoribosyltransferase n=1 Tax=Actinomadura atramentaria TaxID=1990 RepID=UPI000376BA30|nr:phosphoribosyltransferase family protein [Actinomadura atramentaria]